MKVLSVFTGACLFCATALSAEPKLANAIQAVVHESVVTDLDVKQLDASAAEVLMRLYRGEPAVLEEKLSKISSENLQTLIDRQLILHEFKTAGYALPESVTDELVQQRIRNQYGTRAKLAKTLQEEGITFEKFRQYERERFIIDQLKQKNVSSEIIVSPHKIETYYQEHRAEYEVADSRKVRVIILRASQEPGEPSPQKMAENLLDSLDGGADFAELATTYSQGSQRSQGGDWGWWQRPAMTMGLADVVFALPKGKHSGVLSRSAGDDYWIVLYDKGQPTAGRHYGLDPQTHKSKMLEERKLNSPADLEKLPPAQEFYLLKAEDEVSAHVRPLAEVRDDIEKNLLVAERKRLEDQWIAKLKKKTFVRRYYASP